MYIGFYTMLFSLQTNVTVANTSMKLDKQSERFLILQQGLNSVSEGIKMIMKSSSVRKYQCKRLTFYYLLHLI